MDFTRLLVHAVEEGYDMIVVQPVVGTTLVTKIQACSRVHASPGLRIFLRCPCGDVMDLLRDELLKEGWDVRHTSLGRNPEWGMRAFKDNSAQLRLTQRDRLRDAAVPAPLLNTDGIKRRSAWPFGPNVVVVNRGRKK